MARKRKRVDTTSTRPAKQVRLTNHDTVHPPKPSYTHHNVLSSFYPRICTLRQYLLANLPTASRVRKRNLIDYGSNAASLLDTCLVGVQKELTTPVKESRKVDFVTFTQTQHSRTAADSGKSQSCPASEIVDFVIWSLFKHDAAKYGRVQHILCHGLQRGPNTTENGDEVEGIVPGVVQRHPNENVAALRIAPWSDVVSLLGADAEAIFSSLLLDCGLFTRSNGGRDNYFQLSGVPISELPRIARPSSEPVKPRKPHDESASTPGNIKLVRHRILYARASSNVAGKVKFGLHHTHIFQRVPDAKQKPQAVHLMKYVFPRQTGLHNVFVSKVDEETTQSFKDYTFREQEINDHKKKPLGWTPRRLRGGALRLVQKLHRNHRSCSYSQLLRHYCPIVIASDEPIRPPEGENVLSLNAEPFMTQLFTATPKVKSRQKAYDTETSFLSQATSTTRVSAFCRGVIANLLPQDAFGRGPAGQHNWQLIMRKIDDFVLMRRFETMTLHQTVQGLRIGAISWLSSTATGTQKMCKSELSKRMEILQEFVYYLFDSLLIPLIRAHFYVTETSSHRQRLFYFRQDIWRKVSEPSLAVLRLSMYVPIGTGEARAKLQDRSLGYSQLRLLPKDQGARPITNLKRRQLKHGIGKRVLGQSINTQLVPLFSVLNFERGRNAQPLGSALLSIGDIHKRMTEFKAKVEPGTRFFFAKVDIRSCFDSIPQTRLLDVVQHILTQPSYRTTKHVEMKSSSHDAANERSIRRKFGGLARPADDQAVLSEKSVAGITNSKRHVVVSDIGYLRTWSRNSLLQILRDHVGDSMVKIGKKYMKQTHGIPQGSVLSSLLCSYFYGDFERKELKFLDPDSSLLLRLIDDFLLITTDVGLARRFLETMANGDTQYGIQVNAEKSLANFDVEVNGHRIPRLHASTSFPYCGVAIDMDLLHVSKDREKKDAFVNNSLTVERSFNVGHALRRKTISSLKMQMHAILLDMTLNSRQQVISTMIGNFTESAMKLHQYLAAMSFGRRPSQEFVRGLIEELISAGTKLCRVKNNDRESVKHITHAQMCWIASAAFERVLQRKQSQYKNLMTWLRALKESTRPKLGTGKVALDQLIEKSTFAFRGYVY